MSYVFSYTINSANTWERKTITIPPTTSGSFGTGNANGIQVHFEFGVGSNRTAAVGWQTNTAVRGVNSQVNLVATNAATWRMTGLQLEVGSVATDFEHRSFEDELNRCLRYCYVAGGAGPATDNYERFGAGWGYDSTRTRIQIFHPIPMRTAPTVSIPTIGDLQASDSSNGYQCSAYERVGSVNGAMSTGIQFTHSSGVTAHRPMFVEARNTTAARIILAAEL